MIPYVGGKSALTDWIIGTFPEHRAFVEVFGGAGWVTLAKSPSDVEVYNDIDDALINLFRVVRDTQKSKEFLRRAKWMLHSRAEQLTMRKIYQDDTAKDDIDKALAFAYYMTCSRSGKRKGMSFKLNKSDNATAPASWQSFLRRIVETRNRLRPVIIESLDYADLVMRYDSPDTLFYLDPPYIKSDYYYCVNWKPADHERLAGVLRNIKGKFVLSYYDGDYVRSLYPDCHFLTKESVVKVWHSHGGDGSETKPRSTELLITNFQPMVGGQLTIEHYMSACQG